MNKDREAQLKDCLLQEVGRGNPPALGAADPPEETPLTTLPYLPLVGPYQRLQCLEFVLLS